MAILDSVEIAYKYLPEVDQADLRFDLENDIERLVNDRLKTVESSLKVAKDYLDDALKDARDLQV